MPFIQTGDGTRLFYKDWGTGEPALIIHGDSDAMIPFEVSGRGTATAIPHSQLTLYHNASHGLFVSHRERLNADLIEFIKHRAQPWAMDKSVGGLPEKRRT